MPTPWDEASRCPEDGSTGKVESRKGHAGGQLVTLTCQKTRCMYHETGWIVQIRPDNTIPDRVTAEERRQSNGPRPKIDHTAAQRARDLIAEQVANEQKPGTEVRGL